ncbi:MAG: BamA/TamA family outer membrane protein, partial [Rhodothermia bacterium]
RPNRNFLGIPGMPLWLWMYSLGDAGCCFGERIEQTLVQSGEPPAFLDAGALDDDAERLELFYRREGYRDAVVTTRIDTLTSRLDVGIAFVINAGLPRFMRTITFDGLDKLTDDQRSMIVSGSVIDRLDGNFTDSLAFSARSERYSESKLVAERRRIVSLLRDEGYARLTRDSVRAFVTPVGSDSFDVRIRVRTGSRYKFGDVAIYVEGPEVKPTRMDTLVRPGSDSDGYVVASVNNEGRLNSSTLLKAMHFRPGEWFSQSKLLTTKRRMESIGIFTFSDFVPQWNETAVIGTAPVGLQNATTTLMLPYDVELQTRRRHQLRIESFILQRNAVLGDETSGGEVGVGIGTTYRNASLLGAGELFQVRLAGSIAADLATFNPFQSAQAELDVSLTYPYLWWPFRSLDRKLSLYAARSRLHFQLLAARRESVFLIIHARASFSAALEMQHSEKLTSFLSPLEFNLSDPDTLTGFGAQFLDPIEDPVEKERVLEDYTRPQINTAIRYTIRSSTANLFKRDRGHIIEVTPEIGGNIPYLLDRFVFTPDTIEGSIPGIPIFKRPDGTNDLVYRQYVRILADARHYKPVLGGSVVAYKAVIGVGLPIGTSDVVPFDRRFYSGGPVSVRAWGLRELGPGRVVARDSVITGGDIKLEAAVEARATLLRGIMKADWISAFFVDVGNNWYGARNPGQDAGRFRFGSFYRELGIGAGLGLRLAWDYLIIRFDLAFKVHDPVDGFFKDGSPAFHFGIGQAF